MAKTEELKAISSTLSALCDYRKLYALNTKERIEFDETIEKVYKTLIKTIND